MVESIDFGSFADSDVAVASVAKEIQPVNPGFSNEVIKRAQ
jgi:hypothetical protein